MHDYTVGRVWPTLPWEAGHLSATLRVFTDPILQHRCCSLPLGDRDRTPTPEALEAQLAELERSASGIPWVG